MPWLPEIKEEIDAAECMRRAREAYAKRRAAYDAAIKAKPVLSAGVVEKVKEPSTRVQYEGDFVYPITDEVARQTGVDSKLIKDGRSKVVPITQYRQLALALACHLTGKSTTQIGKHFGLDHTTVMHARNRMACVIESAGLTKEHSLRQWVSACLPLLFAYLEQLRTEHRHLHGNFGKGEAA